MHVFVKHTSVHSINDIPKLSLRWDNVFLVSVPQSYPLFLHMLHMLNKQ